MSGVQPCEAFSSPVKSNLSTSSQPTTSPLPLPPTPLDAHSRFLLSNCRWCVLKHVSTNVNILVFGSYIHRPRPDLLTGNSFAEGWSEPGRQKAAGCGPCRREVNQARPLPSIIGLCGVAWLSQMRSSL